jgi:hypothetical protein
MHPPPGVPQEHPCCHGTLVVTLTTQVGDLGPILCHSESLEALSMFLRYSCPCAVEVVGQHKFFEVQVTVEWCQA